MWVTEVLKKISTIVENDEQATKMHCEILGRQTETLNHQLETNNFTTSNVETAERYTKFHETKSSKQLVDKNEDLNNLLKELEIKAEELKDKLAKLETEREQLKSEKDYSQHLTKLEDLRMMLKCCKAVFPVEFDYADKNVAGLMYNKSTGECHGFELSPKASRTNVKYAWKHLEKLYN